MQNHKKLTLSIIIPCYNEAEKLARCLQSISNQTVKTEEVIVVDNNCTDDTVKIAKSFSFVRVITETKQGLIPARNRGFNAASGDILGRIDADSNLRQDWVLRVKNNFTDPELQGLTGLGRTRTIAHVPRFYTVLWSYLYFHKTDAFFRVPVLWGANMAVRSSAWRTIQGELCTDDKKVHEDQDISIHLFINKLKAARDNRLLVQTEGQVYFEWPKLVEYTNRRTATRHRHLKLLKRVGGRMPAAKSLFLRIVVAPPIELFFYVGSFSYFVLETLWRRGKRLFTIGLPRR